MTDDDTTTVVDVEVDLVLSLLLHLHFWVPHSRLPGVGRRGCATAARTMRNKLERRYGQRQLHFITCSCYRRQPLLGTARKRDVFPRILNEVRERYQFWLVGYVAMPEHIHLLISEPRVGTPSTVMQVLKQRVARALRRKPRRRTNREQMRLWNEAPAVATRSFWQRRFYDFNVWSAKKRIEKLNYMHRNPVKRGLVAEPGLWSWSSYRFYQYGEKNGCTPEREPR